MKITEKTKEIGFKNFRRFKEFPMLEFGNITYMVGRNNSGKSTMVKALLLTLDYLQNQLSDTFSFDNLSLEDANIVTFGRAKCNLIDEPEIEFNLKLNNYDIAIHISGDDDRTKANVNVLHIQDGVNGYELRVNYNTKRIQVVKKSISINTVVDTEEELEKLQAEINRLKESRDNISSKGSKEALQLADVLNKMVERRNKIAHANEPQEEVNNIEYDLEYPLNYQIDEDDDSLWYSGAYSSEEHIAELKEFDEEDEEDDDTDDKTTNPRTEDNELKEIISIFLYHNTIAYKQSIEQRNKSLNDEVEEDDSFSDIMELDNTQEELKDWIDNLVKNIEQESYYYLGANPSKQSALFYLRDKNNALAQAIHNFYQLGVQEGDKEWEFVKKWMSDKIDEKTGQSEGFEVGNNFKINFLSGEAYEFKVIQTISDSLNPYNVETQLSDKGMGSLQAMLLILRVASLIRINKKKKKAITLLVEEPELNLHPALQSKLTDFFHEVNRDHGFNFIVETHSEYIIRKTQLIAVEEDYIKNQAINPNPFKIFYFHKKEGPYEMEFTEQGKFKKDFGPGFYNEASNISIEIIKNIRKNKS